jgi:hypothetical protein
MNIKTTFQVILYSVVIITGCTNDDDCVDCIHQKDLIPSDTINVPDELKTYTVFPVGTKWVYENGDSEIDTVSVQWINTEYRFLPRSSPFAFEQIRVRLLHSNQMLFNQGTIDSLRYLDIATSASGIDEGGTTLNSSGDQRLRFGHVLIYPFDVQEFSTYSQVEIDSFELDDQQYRSFQTEDRHQVELSQFIGISRFTTHLNDTWTLKKIRPEIIQPYKKHFFT